jgi:hypothetical protein
MKNDGPCIWGLPGIFRSISPERIRQRQKGFFGNIFAIGKWKDANSGGSTMVDMFWIFCNELNLGIKLTENILRTRSKNFMMMIALKIENQDVRIFVFQNEMVYHHIEEVLFKIRSVIIEMKSLMNKSK